MPRLSCFLGGDDKVLQPSARPAQLQGRLEGVVAAAIDRDFAAVELGARLGRDVYDARRAVAELGRQGACQERH